MAGGVAFLLALRQGDALQPLARPEPITMLSDRVLTADEACRDVGYLCAPLEVEDSLRLLRWPDGKSELTVAVRTPDWEDVRRAEALRQAAARGVLRWHDAPLRLSILAPDAGPADVTIEWTRQLDGAQLGVTRTRWGEVNGVARFEVTSLLLATHSPLSGRPLTPEDVELVAVHEFGHALGLPHSPSSSDVMYPEKTARFPTRADWRTAEGLYRSPNGAKVVRGRASPGEGR